MMHFTDLEWALAEVQFTSAVNDEANVTMLIELGFADYDRLQHKRLFLTSAGMREFKSIPREKRIALGQEVQR